MQSNFARAQSEHRSLLAAVRHTVDALFQQAAICDAGAMQQPPPLPPHHPYPSALLRSAADLGALHAAVEAVFQHGLLPDLRHDCWPFIEGLNWLNPSMCQSLAAAAASEPQAASSASPATIRYPSARIRGSRALRWLYDQLAAGSLLGKLQYLVSDAEHLSACYEVWAFMRSARFVGALVLCLRAVENVQANLLGQIEGCCLLAAAVADDAVVLRDGGAERRGGQACGAVHRRSTSHPDFSFVPQRGGGAKVAAVARSPKSVTVVGRLRHSKSVKEGGGGGRRQSSSCTQAPIGLPQLRRTNSLPVMHVDLQAMLPASRIRCRTMSQRRGDPLTPSATSCTSNPEKTVPRFEYKSTTVATARPPPSASIRQHSQPQLLQPISLVRCDDIKIHFDHKHAAITAASAAAAAAAASGKPPLPTAASSSAIPIDPSRQRPPVPQGLLYSLLPMLSKSPTPGDEKADAVATGGSGSAPGSGAESPSLYATLFAASPAPSDFVNAFIPREGEKLYERQRSTNSLLAQPITPAREIIGISCDPFEDVEPFGSSTPDTGTLAASWGLEAARRTKPAPAAVPNTADAAAGGSSIRPTPEQSLTRFLQSAQFSCANSDLERENAHFSVSEAMISALEQMKCRRLLAHAQLEQVSTELRRRRMEGPVPLAPAFCGRGGSGGPAAAGGGGGSGRAGSARDTNDKYRRAVMSGSSASSSATSSFGSPGSAPPLSRHPPPPPSTSSTLHPASRHQPAGPHSSSTASSYSSELYGSSPDDSAAGTSPRDPRVQLRQPPANHHASCPLRTVSIAADALSPPADDAEDADTSECRVYAEWGATRADTWSAESVALSLIAKFSDQQLPKAGDLLWLVSEQDAPQKLLPLPGSWTVNPDEPYKIPFTRGTRDWAPPRAQVIFTRHEKLSRQVLMERQKQRCAGCGMRVAAAYSHRFRYCEYLGRYHCTNCHRNQIAVIPARVLHGWDFGSRPVSVFAYRLLEQISAVPVLRVAEINAQLYGRVRPLQTARVRRGQLRAVRDFVVACRFAAEDGTKQIFDQVAVHIVDDLDAWSMCDFQAVRAGTFVRDINAVIVKCEQHVLKCELCNARGFICERCPRKQIIFPWQPKVRRCPVCGTCVHESCWQDDNCGRCQRLHRRRFLLQRNNSTVSAVVPASCSSSNPVAASGSQELTPSSSSAATTTS